LLSRSGPFSRLPDQVVELVVFCMRERDFAEGDLLMEQGTPGDCMMVLESGKALVHVRDREGESTPLATVGEGAVLGEMALLTSEPRNADVQATNAGQALVLLAEDFHRLVERYPDIAVVLTHLVAERLGQGRKDGLGDKIFFDYRILGRLGLGAMSVVYEAEHVETGHRVALKMMSHRLVYDPVAVERFHREVGIVESLEHANVAKVFGTFPAYGTQFMVQEYCDGPSLDALVERCGALPEDQVRRTLGQLTAALVYVHQHELIHQDLKPANVLTMRDGTVKLVDFGIAQPRSQDPDAPAVRAVHGTPLYMAPEQFRGGVVGAKTDLYAVGCLVWEMLTGRPLFEADSFGEMVRMKMMAPPPTRDDLGCDVSDELWAFLEGSLRREREKRVVDMDLAASWAAPLDAWLLEHAVEPSDG
jgi:serine/threonine protein kinase